MNKPRPLILIALRKDDKDGWIEKDLLLNAEGIVSAEPMLLERGGEILIGSGQEQERHVTKITTIVGSVHYVVDTVDQVAAAIIEASK